MTERDDVKYLVKWILDRSMPNQTEDEIAEDLENPLPLVEQLAENMSIYAGGGIDDSPFMPRAEQLLRWFEASDGRPATNYLEIEQWAMSHLDEGGRFPGGGDGPG